MKHIHTSDIQAYSRYVLVYSGIAECEYCKTKKQILSVDTSDDEYQRFECCLDCFTGLLKMGEDKEKDSDTNMILDPELAKRMHMDRDGNIGIGSPEMRKAQEKNQQKPNLVTDPELAKRLYIDSSGNVGIGS